MPEPRRWTVDALDESVARVETDDERAIVLPRWLLPAGAREGDVLTVARTPDGRHRVTIALAVDREATRAAVEESRAQVEETKRASAKHDRGGDVEL